MANVMNNNNPNRFLRAIMPQGVPLFPEKELQHAANGQFWVKRPLSRFDRGLLTPCQRRRPMVPIFTVLLAKGIEQNEIFQPPEVLLGKKFEALPRFTVRPFKKILCRSPK